VTKSTPRITSRRLAIVLRSQNEIYKSPLLQLVSLRGRSAHFQFFYSTATIMSPSDNGTDLDSNFEIPGSLTDTTNSPERPYERRRAIDAVNSLRATR
jgi:hypothetical protein